MSLKLRTLSLGLMLFVTSCNSFNWEPRPYVGDSITQSLVNSEGEVIQCSQPAFDEMTCFDAENIAELKTAIDEVKDEELKHKLLKKLNEVKK